MMQFLNARNTITTLLMLAFALFAVGLEADAQTTKRKKRARRANVAATVPPVSTDPATVVSRADDYQDSTGQIIQPVQMSTSDPSAQGSAATTEDPNTRRLRDIQSRVKRLESGKSGDDEASQKRLTANLDLLTKAEERAETLRRQRFELIEKQNAIQSRLDQIEIEIRPEMIERSVSSVGSMRPEELRDARKRSLESERRNLQSLLNEVTSARDKLDVNLARAEDLVGRLRDKLDGEIDSAFGSPERDKP